MAPTVLFLEPPKEFWFLMGDYLPPPTQLLALAAYLEREMPDVHIELIDSQAEQLSYATLKDRIARVQPDVVAVSGNMTCNAYTVARTVQLAKEVDPAIKTIVGGQHFSFLADESLRGIPELDFIIRGEGEVTFIELLRAIFGGGDPRTVAGLSLRHNGGVLHTPDRPFIEDLDSLPIPAYHLVERHLDAYHFSLMTGKGTRYMVVEGSRGCPHRCTFCTQSVHWKHTWRTKSPKRIADEFQTLHERYGGGKSFMWLADDNFMLGHRGAKFVDAMSREGFGKDLTWFVQARADDLVHSRKLLPGIRKAGGIWMLVGVEHSSDAILHDLGKESPARLGKEAIHALNEAGILSQAMFILGSRRETTKSIQALREFVNEINPAIAIFACLTPFPGTELHAAAAENGWIEDTNWAHYDMVHAIMPTETLSRQQVQEELFQTYRDFFGSAMRGLRGVVARNPVTRRAYAHMLKRQVLRQLRGL
jgi:anaerobic magnesium-protoporphyrin IX monomethyl ester cyclase